MDRVGGEIKRRRCVRRPLPLPAFLARRVATTSPPNTYGLQFHDGRQVAGQVGTKRNGYGLPEMLLRIDLLPGESELLDRSQPDERHGNDQRCLWLWSNN